MTKFLITYHYLVYGDDITRNQIKEFGYYIRKLTDILDPKLIVCMGEEAQLSFFKRKFVMEDFHGKQIGEHDSIPIYTTFPIFYYEERSEYEDKSFKEHIKKVDWEKIKEVYSKVVKK